MLNQNYREFRRNSFLGGIATETFVEERLLPLLSNENEPFKSNLREVLKIAGRKHRRRYIKEKTIKFA
jgi:hypothetical protein